MTLLLLHQLLDFLLCFLVLMLDTGRWQSNAFATPLLALGTVFLSSSSSSLLLALCKGHCKALGGGGSSAPVALWQGCRLVFFLCLLVFG